MSTSTFNESDVAREKAGQPTGGQFAEKAKAASGIALAAEQEAGPRVDHPRDDLLIDVPDPEHEEGLIIEGDGVGIEDFEVHHADGVEGYEMVARTPAKDLGDLIGEQMTPYQARRFLERRRIAVGDFVRQRYGYGGPELDTAYATGGVVALVHTTNLDREHVTNAELAQEADEVLAASQRWSQDMTADGGPSPFGQALLDYLDTRVVAPPVGADAEERREVLARLESGEPFDTPLPDSTAKVLLEAAAQDPALVQRREQVPYSERFRPGGLGVHRLVGSLVAGEADRDRVLADLDIFARTQPRAAEALRTWVTNQPTARQELERVLAEPDPEPWRPGPRLMI